ncbi:MAG TPA: hypothetical protein VFN14_06595 [Candidatus Limnocylindria bacterium]|nr:hypothetical protein [Candidatus Limnocylindria bacterium]
MPADRDASVEDPIDADAGGGRRDPAMADAQAVVDRVERDEIAARTARERLREGPMIPIIPDATISPLLHAGEQVLAVREAALLNPPSGDPALPGYGGALYLTSERLVHTGRVLVSIALDQVREVSLAGERLLLTLDGGEGMTLETDRPRLLRVEISAAQRSLR